MAYIPTIKESLDLLFAYGEEIYKRDLNEELKQIYSKSINRAVYAVKQWGLTTVEMKFWMN
jgi:hypothetical protein